MLAGEMIAILKNAVVKIHEEKPSKGLSMMYNLDATTVQEIQEFRNTTKKIQKWTIIGSGFAYWLNEPPQANVISQIPVVNLVSEKTSPQMIFVYSASAQVLYVEIWTD